MIPWLLALAQTSLLVSPLYLSEAPPEGRAVQDIMVIDQDTPGAPRSLARTRDQARELAESIHARVTEGADFGAMARRHSDHASNRFDGILGTVWPGMLPPELDEFLFRAEVGQVSDVIETPTGFHVLRRIERDVAWRQIRVDGTDDAARTRCRELLRRLQEGADFGELARTESDDAVTAPRGGVAGILQRGPRDTLLKAAAFRASVGEVVGPIETPFALIILQRMDPALVDPALREPVVVRMRAILIAFAGAVGADPVLERTRLQAEDLTRDLATRIRGGEDMATLAGEWTDDGDGRQRQGDLGWIMRQASDVPTFLDQACAGAVGELLGPYFSDAGWVLLRRER